MLRFTRVLATLLLSLSAAALGDTIPGDAARGAEVFKAQKCVTCHSISGEGGKSAPDLSKRPTGQYSPSLMAAAIWNHGPQMWSAMEAAGISRPQLTADEAADLFAHFYAFRYFEQPGDAARGKRLFESKGCEGCHGAASKAGAPPIRKWPSVTDSIQFARELWNHAPKMQTAMGKTAWPTLSAQEMSDILVYVQSQPDVRKAPRRFAPASATTGEVLFREKGCADCHTGAQALRGRGQGQTIAGLAAAMWNHAPQMRGKARELRPEEMTRLVGYLWSIQYFDPPGDPSRGSRVVEEKKCSSCHGVAGSGAPSFSSLAGKIDSITFVSDTWKHGPDMLAEMRKRNVEWPRFEKNQLSDVLAYINSL
ncbi:MAG: c-type cytochrome [Bryobacteraceae bacterium]|nr:c-type cytochrome [Bryobacteraceae bacterium]